MSISPDPGGLRRSPLEYPVNDVQSVRIFLFNRAPRTSDRKNFRVRDMWIHTPSDMAYMLVRKTSTDGIWILLGGPSLGDVDTLTGDTGGAVGPDGAGNINVLGGSGATVDGNPGTNTLIINVNASGLTWTTDVVGPINVNAGEGRICNGALPIVYNLPATCAVGDGFAFVELSNNGFIVTAAAGDQIIMGNQITAAGGTISSTGIGDVIELMCVVADTTFFVVDSIGNFTVT